MKRFFAVVIAAILAVTLLPAGASAGKGKNKKQEVEGNVLLATPFPPDDCFSGLHRRASLATGGNANGLLGFDFDVDKKTWGQPFTLTLEEDAQQDLDIIFYTDFGPFGTDDPTGSSPGATVDFKERGPGGEAGEVPEGFKKAIVCMFDGAGASFTYTAGKGVKAKK